MSNQKRICLCAVNASYTHTSLALHRLKSVCAAYAPVCAEYTINDSVERVCAALYAMDCTVYAFGCYIWNLPFLERLTARLKAVKPESVILLGGPEISYETEEFMLSHPCIDFCLRGEGEESLPAFLSGRAPEIVQGLCYRKEGKVILQPPAYVFDLAVLPKIYDYGTLCALQNKIVYYETSRGCPYRCSYCLSSVDKNVRFFDEAKVLEELKLMMDAEVALVKFTDRTFNLGDVRTARLLRFMQKHNKKTCFHFEISADVLGEETMTILENAPQGMFQLEIGVQTTNLQSGAAIDRHADFEKIRANVLRLKKAGNMHMHLDLIAGLPYESYVSFAHSFNDVFALSPDMLQLGFLKLLKGTKIRAQAEAYNYVCTPEPPYEVLKSNWISYKELCRLKEIEHVLDVYYNSASFASALRFSMEQSGIDAFSYFERLAAFWKEHTTPGASYGQGRLFSLFYEFHTTCIEADDGKFNALLVYEQMRVNQTAQPAAWAKLPPADKAFYAAAWRQVEKSGCLPAQYFALKQKEFLRRVRILRMDYDVFTLKKRDSITIFDYENKNTYSLAVESYEENNL